MTIDTSNLLESIINSLSRIDYIKPENIPDIALYMDQVTTLMDANLSASKRHPEDKILTKTMINNYAKNNLLPPPEKKKYSKEHIITLLFIYYLKNVMSINDIQTMLSPITDQYFSKKSGVKLEDIYGLIFGWKDEIVDSAIHDIQNSYKLSEESLKKMTELTGESTENLQQFSFICLLAVDIYIKKLLIEKMIDGQDLKTTKAKKSKDSKGKEPKGK